MNPVSNPEAFSHYFYIIDGEVVWKHSIEKSVETEIMHAVFSSNPDIVPAPDEIAATIELGWTYDGTNFNPPA
jgi:hypothetical protein